MSLKSRIFRKYVILLLLIILFGFLLLSVLPPSNFSLPEHVILLSNSSDKSPLISSKLGAEDINKLFEMNNFQFLINNYLCNNSSPLVLTLITSATKNINRRNSIRQTWGSMVSDEFKLLFLLGDPNSKKAQQALNEENQIFKDLIQGNFQDNYRNLTYKHVMALKWTTYYCPGSKYILKTDDDVFVNTPALMDFINNTLSPFGARNLIACEVSKNRYIYRESTSRYYVKYSEFNGTQYPPYCRGYIVLYSVDMVFNLYRLAQNAPFFWLEDVFATGFLTQKGHYKLVDLSLFILKATDDNYSIDEFFFTRKRIRYFYQMWEDIVQNQRNSSLELRRPTPMNEISDDYQADYA